MAKPGNMSTLEIMPMSRHKVIGHSIVPLRSDGQEALDWLLNPLPVSSFLRDFWGKSHVHVSRADDNYFKRLLSREDIGEYLQYPGLDFDCVRIVRNGEMRSPDSCRRSDGRVDLNCLDRAFAEGYTIVLNKLEQYSPRLSVLARQIENELNFDVAANAYISPAQSTGFKPHFDGHDVIVLQIQGSKDWQIFECLGDVPSRELGLGQARCEGDLPDPEAVRLEAGDMLYVPRGRVHSANTRDEASIHLTIGIHPPSMLGLIGKVVEALGAREDRIQDRLPPQYLNNAGARDALIDLVIDAISLVDDQAIRDGIGSMEDQLLRRGRCEPPGNLFTNDATSVVIGPGTVVRRSALTMSRVLFIGDGIGFQFAESLLKAEKKFEDALVFIHGSIKSFRVAELPGIEMQEQLMLANKLLSAGFLLRV